MDVNQLANLLLDEKNKMKSYRRYPVRFLPIPLSNDVEQLIIGLSKKLGLQIIQLSKELPHEDAWMSKESLLNLVSNLNPTKDYIIVGLSEITKFYSKQELESLIFSLVTDIENDNDNGKRRIYFTCFALVEHIKKIIKDKYSRNGIFDPFIEIDELSNIEKREIYFVEPNMQLNALQNNISSTSEWLSLWRNQDVDFNHPIICTSQTLFDWYQKASPDNVFSMEKLYDYKQVAKYVFGIDISYEYKPTEGGMWKRLVEELSKDKKLTDLYSIIRKFLKVSEIDVEEIVSVWCTKNAFERWLVRIYIVNQNNSNYISEVISEIPEYTIDAFGKRLWTIIFQTENYEHGEQRKALLRQLNKYAIRVSAENEIKEEYNRIVREYLKAAGLATASLQDFDCCSLNIELISKSSGIESSILNSAIRKFYDEKASKVLTHYSETEKNIIVSLYNNKIINDIELKSLYLGASQYLSQECINRIPNTQQEIYKYLAVYRRCKMGQENSEQLKSIQQCTYSDDREFFSWYYNENLPYVKEKLGDFPNIDTVFVLDGVGGEYMDYIVSVIQSRGRNIIDISFAKSYLPSITKISRKYFPDSFRWEDAFDKTVIHGDSYNRAKNINKALEKLDGLLDIVLSMPGNKVVAIVADHGSTVAHKIIKTTKKYDFDGVEHAGRCKELGLEENIQNCHDYISYTADDGIKWLIALNETSLENTSKYEVHGGATIEEIVVPVIILGTTNLTVQSIYYSVKPINLLVSGLNPTITFEITPQPKGGSTITDESGKSTALLYKDGLWECTLPIGRKQKIKLNVGSQTFEFETESKMSLGTRGDGFDD